jgi:hypothetical protein
MAAAMKERTSSARAATASINSLRLAFIFVAA